uniref:Integrase zinc-binding domain-containing protein n=1 Tax=Strigamia maritima TaxID=126957 RepID=T1IKH4_STRMM
MGEDIIHLCKCEVKLRNAEICVKFSNNEKKKLNKPPNWMEKISGYMLDSKESTNKDGLLVYFNPTFDEELNDSGNGFKAVVPRTLIRRVMFACHGHPLSGHAGISKTLHRTKQIYYWPRMSRDIRVYVRSCQHCQQYKPNQDLLPYIPSYPIEEWEENQLVGTNTEHPNPNWMSEKNNIQKDIIIPSQPEIQVKQMNSSNPDVKTQGRHHKKHLKREAKRNSMYVPPVKPPDRRPRTRKPNRKYIDGFVTKLLKDKKLYSIVQINNYEMGRHHGKSRHVSKHAYRDKRYESTDSSSVTDSTSSKQAYRKRRSKKSASTEPRTPKKMVSTGTTPATSTEVTIPTAMPASSSMAPIQDLSSQVDYWRQQPQALLQQQQQPPPNGYYQQGFGQYSAFARLQPLAQVQVAPRNQIRMEPVIESAPSVSSVDEPKEPMPEEAIDWNGPKNLIQIELMKVYVKKDFSILRTTIYRDWFKRGEARRLITRSNDFTSSVPDYLLPKTHDVNRPDVADAPPPAGYHR